MESSPMPITVIDSDRLYRKIARMLSALIVGRRKFVTGQRLPGERELAQTARGLAPVGRAKR